MTDDHSTPPIEPSWFERLTQIFSREPQNHEALLELLRDAKENNVISADTLSMLECVLQVSDMRVRDVMIPRAQMVVVKENATPKEFLPILIESKHSRFPVVNDEQNRVIGILLAKDLLEYDTQHQTQPIDIHRIARPATFVPESKRLDVLLKEFRISHTHMAIVVDEYGEIAGLVTIEDVLEQIVGDIEDETDINDEEYIKPHEDGSFIVKAQTPVEFFNEYFSANFSEEEFDTIGGIVTKSFERMPVRGEKIVLEKFEFKVLHADNRRILLLRVKRR